jgi:hypothetical protein
MRTHVSSTQVVTGNSRPVLKALGGTALALAVAAGVILLRGTGQQGERTAPAAASLQSEPVAVESVAKLPGSNATLPQVLSATTTETAIIYIAGSEEEAAGLWRFIAEINAQSVGADRASHGVTILVARSSEDEAQLQARIAQIREVQHSIGLPMSQVFDLRAG